MCAAISKTDVIVAWMMFKEWVAKVFGSRPEFHVAPGIEVVYTK